MEVDVDALRFLPIEELSDLTPCRLTCGLTQHKTIDTLGGLT